MSYFFTALGTAILIFCAIWSYSWLEIWRDPKGDLSEFLMQHPKTKLFVSRINKAWAPALVAGLILIIIGAISKGES